MTELDPNRLYWIDAIRSFACVCVLLSHAFDPVGAAKVAAIEPIRYLIVAGASVLFFMISGALVFYKPKPLIPFMKRRLVKIALPMVIWTIVALLIECLRHDMEWSQLPHKLMLIPFTQQFGTFWFIYVIFGIYLLTPMIATWLERCSRAEVRLLLIVSCVAMAIPYLRIVDKEFPKALFTDTGSFYYFAGYLWICLMGYYIRRYINIERYKWWHYAILVAILLMPVVLLWLGEPAAVVKRRTNLSVVLLCACYFVILKHLRLSDRMKRVVYDFAQHSFGIYLVHNHIYNFILAPIFAQLGLHYSVAVPLAFLLCLVLSYAVVHLISKLSIGDYLVAYNS